MGDLLIVIDFQNVYLEGQPWACQNTLRAWKNTKKLIDSNLVEQVIFTKFLPPVNPEGTWQTYNREYKDINDNPWMNEFIKEAIPYAEKYPVYEKCKYSSYSNEKVMELAKKADRVLLAGVVAECCVLFTAISGMDAGNQMIYLEDCVSGLNEEYEEMTKNLISYYSPMHAKVMTSDEYIIKMGES